MNGEEKRQSTKRRLEGVVVSDKMQKTVVVSITRLRKHSKYLKYHKKSQHFKAHDEENSYKVGDRVIIEETRPLSKDKRWKVIGKSRHQSESGPRPQASELDSDKSSSDDETGEQIEDEITE